MNRYCIDLRFSWNPLRDGLDINSFPMSPNIVLDDSHFSAGLKDFLMLHGLRNNFAVLFTLPPNTENETHRDIAVDDTDVPKLNWSYSSDHVMRWYQIRPDTKQKLMTDATTAEGGTYSAFNPRQMDLAHEQVVGFPSLVNPGIPHNVRNGAQIRRCLSVPLRRNDGSMLDMDQAIALMSGFIVG